MRELYLKKRQKSLNKLKISIITATYNSEATIRHTLECIQNQSHPHIEHIIVDGGSTDQTMDIVATFPHVAKVICEPDQGIYDAMNKGILAATGDIIGILNSDDFYAYDHVLEQVEGIFRQFSVDSVYSNLDFVKNEDFKIVRRWISGPFHAYKFYHGWMPPHPTFFATKKAYEDFGLFDLNMGTSADYELMLRFLLKNQLTTHYLDRTTVHMRMGGASTASIQAHVRANIFDRKAWLKNNLDPKWYTLYMKPARKIVQYFPRLIKITDTEIK